jgi:4-carboxymuconolactone decarboxylase
VFNVFDKISIKPLKEIFLNAGHGSRNNEATGAGEVPVVATMLGRVPYPSLEELSPVKHARVFDPTRKSLLNVSHMALHASDGLWEAQAALGRATIDSDIDKRLREMVILRLAHLQNSDYELFHHSALARSYGVTDAEQAVILGDDLSSLAPPEHALITFVTEVIQNVSPTDAAVAAMRHYYSDTFMFDVVIVIGSYMLTARIAAVGGITIEDQPVTAW